jgi:3',5'-cyclic-AMP phosphodiesterase
MKVLQVTDTHMPPSGGLIYGVDARARLDACIEDINAHHADAHLCIFTGDLVNVGSDAEYENLRASIDKLRVPYRLMMGNHDDREAMRRFFPDAPRDGDGHVQSAISTPAGRLLLLDTHDAGRASGWMCERRIAWLAARLDEDDAPVYLFLHHPPLRVGIEYMDGIGLRNPEALWDCLAPHVHRVRMMAFGHLHRPVSGVWRGIPFSGCPSIVHQVALELGADAGSTLNFNHESPCYAIFQLGRDEVVVHQQRYLENWKTFPRQGKRSA